MIGFCFRQSISLVERFGLTLFNFFDPKSGVVIGRQQDLDKNYDRRLCIAKCIILGTNKVFCALKFMHPIFSYGPILED